MKSTKKKKKKNRYINLLFLNIIKEKITQFVKYKLKINTFTKSLTTHQRVKCIDRLRFVPQT